MSPTARLRAVLAVHAISRTGNVVMTVSIPFVVLYRGGSAVDVGIAAFAATAPILIGGPLGGALIERVGYVKSSVASDVISAVTLLAIPVLAWTVGLPFGGFLALVFCSGLLDLPGESARRVLVPGLAEQAGVPLERAVGHFEAASRLSVLVGAPVAGVLVASFGPLPALVFTASALGLAAVLTASFVRAAPQMPTAADVAESPTGYWRDIAEGFRFCARDPLLRLVVALVLVTNLLDAARFNTLLPLYADQQLGGAEALGWITGAFGGAAFLGSVVFGYVAPRLPRRIPFVVCFVLAGGPSLIAPALGLPLPWILGAAAVSGLAAGALNPILGAVQLERVPVAMRARVLGLVGAGSWAGIPLGALAAGWSAQSFGVMEMFLVVAVLYTLVTLAPLAGGPWRLMERSARSTALSVPPA